MPQDFTCEFEKRDYFFASATSQNDDPRTTVVAFACGFNGRIEIDVSRWRRSSVWWSAAVSRGVCETVVEAGLADLNGLIALEEIFPEADRISPRSWRRFLKKPGTVLVIHSGNDVVASAVVLFRSNNLTSRLYSLAVAPQARGRGYAQALLVASEELAKGRGRRVLNLEVRVSNTAAVKLYRGAGFEDAGSIARYYDDGEDALKMRKVLKEANEK